VLIAKVLAQVINEASHHSIKTMSERTLGRTFFNLRYALPGYTFILLILLINQRMLLYLFLEIAPKFQLSDTALSLVGIFFGFLTLLSGSPLGLLVSQYWYFIYFVSYYISMKVFPRFGSYKVLKNEFNVEDDISSLETVFNYIVHSHTDIGVRTYLNRRWDLLMLFGSTGWAIVLGLVSGYTCRDWILNLNAIPKSRQTYVFWPSYDWLILIASGVLLFFFSICYIFVWKEHDRMSTFVIRQRFEKPAEKGQKKPREVLPKKYFQNTVRAEKK